MVKLGNQHTTNHRKENDVMFVTARTEQTTKAYFLIDKKYLQKKRKTDISNTVRKRGEKQKRKLWQP